jgi:DNA polymerase I-like protein with 3'-5' exonuclease and polymerase domains
LTRRIDVLETKFKKTNFYKHWLHSFGKEPNIHSNAQLSSFLYKIKKLTPATNTVSGQGSTDEEALTMLNIPELNDLLQIRKLKKIRDTYLEAFVREQVDGWIHPSFNLHLVQTYRSSSDSPNFQNIPKRDKEAMLICRKALLPRPDHQLLEMDFGSLEVRIAAAYHKDPMMLKYITDPTTDMHKDMAQQIFCIDRLDRSLPEHKMLRDATKNGFVFPQFYGDYYKNCAHNLAIGWGKLTNSKWKPGTGIKMPEGTLADHLISQGIKSYSQFEEHIRVIEKDFWENRFRIYNRWKEKWWKMYQKNGYVDLLTGFRCSGLMRKNEVINYPVQGSAFHCLLWSFIQTDKIMLKEKWDTKIIGQVHDSLILDVAPDELSHVVNTIKNVTCVDLPKAYSWINTPLDIEADVSGVNQSWAFVNSYDIP